MKFTRIIDSKFSKLEDYFYFRKYVRPIIIKIETQNCRGLCVIFLASTTAIWIFLFFIFSLMSPKSIKSCQWYLKKDHYCESPQEFPHNKKKKYGEAFLMELCDKKLGFTFDCNEFFQGCQSESDSGTLKLLEPKDLDMTCRGIKNREYFPIKSLTNYEKNFPMAFSKTVKEDYYFLEMELSSTYAPQNFYCFSIDKNAKKEFKKRIQKLSNCLPNVFFAKNEFDFFVENRLMAHFECLKILRKKIWNYIFFLDVIFHLSINFY